MAIAKTYRFNSLFKAIAICIKALYKFPKKVIAFICTLIKSLNLSEVQKALKKDGTFKEFTVKYIQKIVKDKISTIVSNPKLNMASFKIILDKINRFSIFTINNKHDKSAPIL